MGDLEGEFKFEGPRLIRQASQPEMMYQKKIQSRLSMEKHGGGGEVANNPAAAAAAGLSTAFFSNYTQVWAREHRNTL